MKKIIIYTLTILMICSLCIPCVYATDIAFSRGSFCKKIIQTFGIEFDVSGMQSPFDDVNTENEFHNYILFMSTLGFVNGYEDGTFRPYNSITNAEVARLITIMMFGSDFDIPEDVELSNKWYARYAWKAVNSGLMNEPNNWENSAYESCINYDVMKAMISEAIVSSENISLDLSQGSIVIDNSTIISCIFGANEYTQNDNVVTTTGNCIIRQSDSSTPTTNTITVSSSKANITIANLNISAKTSPINIEEGSKLNLILVGDNTVVSNGNNYAGVQIEKNSKIIIDGTGKLSSTGGKYGAGIGGKQTNHGTIIINSGTIVATGGDESAGIGGGSYDACGYIIINGGNITATGGMFGAGIGSGYHGKNTYININAGTINAIGGRYGAGIGGGGYSDGANIKITGGNITATAIAGYASAIGCGDQNINSGNTYMTVYIENATVTAQGGYHAIGGGSFNNSYGCESITIKNSDMTVSHSYKKGSDYQEKIYNTSLQNNHAGLANNIVSISTNAIANSGLAYQWQESSDNISWKDIVGQQSSIANIKMTEDNSSYYYRCKLTNGWNNVVYTNSIQCFILDFIKQPLNTAVNEGDMCILEVEPTCGNVSYQWERSVDGGKSYAEIKDEIYSTLIINADLSKNDVIYRCVITADNGDSLTSNAAKITVVSPDVYYTEKFYLQNANNDDYTAVAQNVVVSTSGTSVTASTKNYDGFIENTTVGTHSGTVATDSSLVLDRYYDRINYTISFDTNGGAVLPELTSKYGADISLPTPARYGYSFEGWYTDNSLTNKTDISTMPLDGATLYAKWNSPNNALSGTEYKINAITLRDSSSYEALASIPEINFIAEISVTNLSSIYTDTIIVAAYDKNGTLTDWTYIYASIDIGETTSLGTLIKNTNGNVSKIKAFVWPTLNSLKPLAESVEIGK